MLPDSFSALPNHPQLHYGTPHYSITCSSAPQIPPVPPSITPNSIKEPPQAPPYPHLGQLDEGIEDVPADDRGSLGMDVNGGTGGGGVFFCMFPSRNSLNLENVGTTTQSRIHRNGKPRKLSGTSSFYTM